MDKQTQVDGAVGSEGEGIREGMRIRLTSGRVLTVIEASGPCERTGQPLWVVHGIRSWTHNGEVVPEDVLLTLVGGQR